MNARSPRKEGFRTRAIGLWLASMSARRDAAAVVRLRKRSDSGLLRVHSPQESEHAQFERAIHLGLGRSPKSLPSMYFYDARGSALFQRIMELPEYYLTRAEREILETHGARIGAPFRDAACDL